jgi:hypothetical protein
MHRRGVIRSAVGAAITGAAMAGSWSVRARTPLNMSKIELFRQIIDRGFNRGDLSVADEVCAPNLVEHQYLTPPDLKGPDILKAQISAARAEMQGLHLEIADHAEAGSKLWARMRGTGVDPRSGRSISIDVFDVCRFEGAKLVEHWGAPDRFALLHQAGALPPRPA